MRVSWSLFSDGPAVGDVVRAVAHEDAAPNRHVDHAPNPVANVLPGPFISQRTDDFADHVVPLQCPLIIDPPVDVGKDVVVLHELDEERFVCCPRDRARRSCIRIMLLCGRSLRFTFIRRAFRWFTLNVVSG